MRKKNRYLVLNFHKCRLLQYLIGRPCLSRNQFATALLAVAVFNILVVLFIIVPGIFGQHAAAGVGWLLFMSAVMGLWVSCCLSDPGWIVEQTIVPQRIGDAGAFDASCPVESQMLHAARDTGNTAYLVELEREQHKFNHQRHLIKQARKQAESGQCCGTQPAFTPGVGSAELQPLIQMMDEGRPDAASQLDRASFVLKERERATCENIGQRRRQQLFDSHRGEYVNLVDRGEFKQVCVVCRVRREMRSHHCKECGRCVSRLDHHCPWISNCVGLGNQRVFYCFIVALLISIVYFYYVAFLYVVDAIVPSLTIDNLASELFASVTTLSFGREIYPTLVFVAAVLNLVWLAFVGALVVRHTAYMMMNVTTYEVLIRPSHMQRRFPQHKGRFWYLGGFSLPSCIEHVWDYWTLSRAHDDADFGLHDGIGLDTWRSAK